MENAKDTPLLELVGEPTASNNNLVGQFGNSHLRTARCQCMKDYLKYEGVFVLFEDSPKEFPSWTREQIEQALEDVINSGYGRVWRVDIDGTIAIDFIEKDEKEKITKKVET